MRVAILHAVVLLAASSVGFWLLSLPFALAKIAGAIWLAALLVVTLRE